ncbi:Transcription initiation factor TFIID subunit 3 [Frankliniella fusca]|uniref:Transcription initiation factor TFIID subunit 3 n=1 Tax=Frankliniella fusca TaxID=407009 RepID=A0AAE1HZT9_9NEOP|nr:Transcription initiation factor TFIID subunit 3 [Frankliniella fusca]
MTGRLFMIGCDKCKEWFHMSCVGIKRHQKLPSKWFCKKCLPSESVGNVLQKKSTPSFNHDQQLQAKLKVQEEQMSLVQQMLNAMKGAMEEKLASITSQLSNAQEKNKIIESLLQQLKKKDEALEDLTSQISLLKEHLSKECKENSILMEALRESEEKYKIQLQSKEGVIASLKEQFDKVAVEPHETPTSQIYQPNAPLEDNVITPFDTNQLVPKGGHTFLQFTNAQNVAGKNNGTHGSQAHNPLQKNETASKLERGKKLKSLSLSKKQPSKRFNISASASQPPPNVKSQYDLADEEDFISLK